MTGPGVEKDSCLTAGAFHGAAAGAGPSSLRRVRMEAGRTSRQSPPIVPAVAGQSIALLRGAGDATLRDSARTSQALEADMPSRAAAASSSRFRLS